MNGVVWIRCPVRDRSAPTGIHTDPNGFRLLPDVLQNVLCPVCGERHLWLKSDAWLEPEEKDPPARLG